MVKRLKKEGYWVRGVDLKYPEFSHTQADDFMIGDLCDPWICKCDVDKPFDGVYQLAADMGGAGFVFTPLESPAIHGGNSKDNIIFLLRKAEYNALFF